MTTVIYLENGLTPQHRKIVQIDKPCIREVAPDWQIPFVAFVDGEPILRVDWELVLEDEQSLVFIDVEAIPQGGGGGSNPLRMVLMLAVMVYAPYLAASLSYAAGGGMILGSTAGLAAMQVGVTMVGMALVNAVAPPPKPTSNQQAAALAAPSPTYSLQAQGNAARLGCAIPEQFGYLQCYPDYAAQPYMIYNGNEQYLYQIFCIGRGEYDFNQYLDVFIEDTPIGNFDEVATYVIPPYSTNLPFPANVTNAVEVSGQVLTDASHLGPFVVNDAGTLVNQLGFDFIAPKGLYYANDDGSLSSVSVSIEIQIASVNSAGVQTGGWRTLTSGTQYTMWSDWTTVDSVSSSDSDPGDPFTAQVAASTLLTAWESRREVTGNPNRGWGMYTYRLVKRTRSTYAAAVMSAASTTPQRWSWSFDVVPGRYTARVRRMTTESTASRLADNVVWGGLRAYHPESSGKNYGDCTLLAIKMRASDNLSSQSSRKINVRCTRKLPVWNGSDWSTNTKTRSVAWAFAHACRQVGLTDAQIDLAALIALDSTCTGRADYFDGRFDNFLSFWEVTQKILGAVRAKPYMQGGIVRIFRDQPATIPVALFSQRNIVKGSFSINYLMPTPDTADRVDVSYFDSLTWKPASVSAILPGSAQQKPAKVDLFGVTGRDQAWREGMYQAACNRYRRKIITFTTEMEGFIPSFGDLISIQHDMPAWGQSGEVTAWNAATKTLTLSEVPEFSTGTHYIALREPDGSVDGPYAVTVGANPNQLVMASSPAITPYVGTEQERTHFAFGAGKTWSQPARVLTATALSLTQVQITAVNEDASVHSSEVGVTMPPQIFSQFPAYRNAPIVTGVISRFIFNSPNHAVVSWQRSEWAKNYYIEVSNADGMWVRVADTTGNSFIFSAYYGVHTRVRVAAVALNRGPWTEAIIEIAVPFDPGAISYAIVATGVQINWPAITEIDSYELRTGGTSWETATLLIGTSINQYLWLKPVTGNVTVWLKTLDVLGNYSAGATSVVVSQDVPKIENSLITVNPDGSLGNAGTGAPDLGQIQGSLGHMQFNDDVMIINLDGTDVDVELRFGRITGGPASLTWNGNALQCSKPFKPVELGLNNISATEPATPFAGQVWIAVV